MDDRYDSSVSLVRLLCLAVEKLGGELEVTTADMQGPDPEFNIQFSYNSTRDSATIQVKRGNHG